MKSMKTIICFAASFLLSEARLATLTFDSNPIDEVGVQTLRNKTTHMDRSLAVIKLTPTADTFIRGGSYADENYGSSSVLVVKQAFNDAYTRRALVQFDLGDLSIPAITSATLRLYVTRAGSEWASFYPSYIGAVDWKESSATWNSDVFFDYADSEMSPSWYVRSGSWVEYDVLELLHSRNYLFPNDNDAFNFMLRSMSYGSDHWINFASRESSNAPELVIQTKPSWCDSGTLRSSDGLCCSGSCEKCGGYGCNYLTGGASKCCGSRIERQCIDFEDTVCRIPDMTTTTIAPLKDESVPALSIETVSGDKITGSNPGVIESDIKSGLVVDALRLVRGINKKCPEGMERAPWDSNSWDGDLNDDVHGEYIYLCRSRKGDALNPISRIKVQKMTADQKHDEFWKLPHRTKLCDEENGWFLPDLDDGLTGDVNQGTGGFLQAREFFSLCYKRDKAYAPIREIWVLKGEDLKPPAEKMVETPNGELNGDMTAGMTESFIWLSIERTSLWSEAFSWVPVFCNMNGPLKYKYTFGRSSTESMSTESSWEISTTISAGFEIMKVVDASVEISASYSNSMTNSWENSASEERELETDCQTHDDGTMFTGGCLWQWTSNFQNIFTQQIVSWKAPILKCTKGHSPACPPFSFTGPDGKCVFAR